MGYSVEEFANEIRKLYPSHYDDLSDEKLVKLWLKKYPKDKKKVDFEKKQEKYLDKNHSESEEENKEKKRSVGFWDGLIILILIWFGISAIDMYLFDISFVRNVNTGFASLIGEYIVESSDNEYLEFDDNSRYFSGEITEADGELGVVLSQLTTKEIAFYREIVATYDSDPSNKLGKSCGNGIAYCEWCGDEFLYKQTYQSRIYDLKQIRNTPFLGFALKAQQLFGALSGENPVEIWANDIKAMLIQIKKKNIYYCGGDPPKYCSEKCRVEEQYY